ncbi:MAG: T9SS type A sorting domain-containing protein, partial [Bacteroidetes bacterium]|nr:T9SS type A sorting domain-containing protein [Bacteroidota bacterium]
GQAFMVQAASNSATLYFNTSIRKHGLSTFYKNTENEDVGYFTLYVTSPQDQYNKTRFYFRDGMTKGLDPSYDVGKMKGNPDLALYSILLQDNGKHFAVQALPYFEEDYAVPVGIDVSQEGQYTFEAGDMEQVPDDVYIFLEDLKTGGITDLKKNSTYTCFLDEAGSITGRFVLHFTLSPFGEKELLQDNTIQIHAYNHIISVYNPEGEIGTLSVVNMLGQPVLHTALSGDENQQFILETVTGYYVVHVVSDDMMISEMVFLL